MDDGAILALAEGDDLNAVLDLAAGGVDCALVFALDDELRISLYGLRIDGRDLLGPDGSRADNASRITDGIAEAVRTRCCSFRIAAC